ncbi:MAG: hypothetical protein WCO93_12270 [bacterium]
MPAFIKSVTRVKWSHLLFILMIAAIVGGTEGCKSSGKLSKKEKKAQIENAKKQLQSIIDGSTTLSLDEQMQLIGNIESKNYGDPQLNQMIADAKKIVKQKIKERDNLYAQKMDQIKAQLMDMLVNKENLSADELEQKLNLIKSQIGQPVPPELADLVARVEKKIADMRSGGAALPIKTQLENSFQTIASSAKSGNLAQADNTIKNTLQYFSSPDAVVLIIISREGNMVDYDKPTTIQRYLNYLKDQKVSRNAIDAIQMDANGKIKSLDLIKK